jgi:hypothetical protein
MRTNAEFRFLNLLTALDVTFLLVSDFTGARIVALHGVGISVTVLYFPLTYLIGDLLTEVYGYARSRRVIWVSVGCSLLGSALAAGQLAVPPAAFFGADAAYRSVFSVSPRTAVAGLVAFFAGDICNSYVLAKMKVWDQGRRLWARFIASTVAGEGVNTLLFYGLALSDVLPRRLLWLSIVTGWSAKVAVEVLLLPLSYAIVRYLKRVEGIDHYDRGTDFNPLRIR